MTIVQAAKAFVSKGVSVVPVRSSDKRPTVVTWAQFQREMMGQAEIEALFAEATGVGVICGNVSNGLECIDFDEEGLYPKWRAVLDENGYEEVASKLVIQETPSGGHHAVYRCLDGVQGNLKLAWTLSESAGRLIRIETRGEGGYFLGHPSPGYRMVQNTWGKIPFISGEDRDTLHSACRMFNEWVSRPYTHKGTSALNRPGDDYASQHSWADILEPAGWTFAYERNGEQFWVRPGKTKRQGIGATTNFNGSDSMKVFSSNAWPFEPDATYTKFCAYATIHFDRNMVAAAASLRKDGFGDQTAKPPPVAERKTEVKNDPDRPRQKWTPFSEIESREAEWLVRPYIPLGEITLVAGDPGDGKSTLAQAIVSHVSNGLPINGTPVPKGKAIFLSAEQSKETVTRPRFEQMGADLTVIVTPDEVDAEDKPVPFVLDAAGMEELREVALELRPLVIVIDTATAYIEATRDFNTANSVREWMRKLADIARTVNCAVIIITHTNKATGQKAIYRVMGSVDFVGASRSVFMVGRDPDAPEVKAAAHIKSNVGPLGSPLGYSLENGEFRWTGDNGLDVDRMFEAPQTREARTNRQECAKWIEELLKNGAVDSSEVERLAKQAGYSRRVLFDAKKDLGVVSERDRFGESGKWVWRMPRYTDQRWDLKNDD